MNNRFDIIKNKIFCRLNFFKQKSNKPIIITKEHHKISKEQIDINALKVIKRLNEFGFEAYIVGGAIRDLLLKRKPKDFDVVTNATPRKIKKIFVNSKIIGRRFKIVHIFFNNKIIETATFRKESKNNNSEKIIIYDNNYGDISEDAKRRDFTLNALYYNPENETIIDYVNGYKDIINKKLVSLKNSSTSFCEDPVRMIRAVKYSVIHNLKLSNKIKKDIKKYSQEILKCSSSRIIEEINKILKSGYAANIFLQLKNFNLLNLLIPIIDSYNFNINSDLYKLIKKTDDINQNDNSFKIELYWLIIIYNKLIIKFNNELITINEIKKYIKQELDIQKVSNKNIDFISRIFYYYLTIINNYNKNLVNKIKKMNICGSFINFVKIVNNDEKIIKKFVNDLLIKNNTKTIKNKKHKKNINSKKFVETKLLKNI